MESNEDVLDSNDFDSVDDDLYDGETAEDDEYSISPSFWYGDGGADDVNDVEHYMEVFEETGDKYSKNYAVLRGADVQKRLDDDIARVLQVLSTWALSRFEAVILLRQFNWSVGKLHEEWFADEEKVRKSVGLFHNSDVVEFPNVCGICFDSFPLDQIASTAYCVHPFCKVCWSRYIGTSIDDGPGCLNLRCPVPSCRAAIDQDMVNRLASDEDKDKYYRFLVRSYIEDNRKTKWCPAPDCECAIEFDFTVGSGSNFDVTCLCSYDFCWNCTEEAHRPVDCSTVGKWILKNCSEAENTNWILVNSKPCPKCKKPIEKNLGCMHMTCRPPCTFQFCWLCLGPWAEHSASTGGNYDCNSYKAAKLDGAIDEAERVREMAKNSLVKYTHYYERWAGNNKSRQKALEDLHRVETVDMMELVYMHGTSLSQLKFIVEAWLQIVECRRVIKWTYAYGYYLPEHEHAKRNLFEYLQGDAESGLERLHHCAEEEIKQFLNDENPSKELDEFRAKLAGLTRVTKHYFENLVRALENGLADVDSTHTEGSEMQVPAADDSLTNSTV